MPFPLGIIASSSSKEIVLYTRYNNNNSLLNVRFGSLLGPRGLLLMYMWGENSI